MSAAPCIYPGAKGGGEGDLVQGMVNALSKGLGDVGKGSGNPLGLFAGLAGLAIGAAKGLNSFGNKFKGYRDFKEKWIKQPYESAKGKVKNLLGMSDEAVDDVAKGAKNLADDAVKGAKGLADDAVRTVGGLTDDAARAAGGLTDDAARAAGAGGSRVLSRFGGPLIAAGVDGAFRYGDYKKTEATYGNAAEMHKAGLISDSQMADAEHARNSGHSRNAAGMAGGLIAASVGGALAGAAVGFGAGGIGAVPGLFIGLGAGALCYSLGSKGMETLSDAAWGNPPSYRDSHATLDKTANTSLGDKAQSRAAGEAWAKARAGSSYAAESVGAVPGTVSDPAVAGRFSQALAGDTQRTPAASEVQLPRTSKPLARGSSISVKVDQQRQNRQALAS